MHVVCAAGARPNFMKIAPVASALEAKGVRVSLVHTGQHYDDEMSKVFFDDLELRAPDHFLDVGSGTHAEQVATVMVRFEPLLARLEPDVVLVAGDVNSTLGCAVVGARSGAFLGHIEAGLRSRDWTMPEELNRFVTDRVSDYLFAPSEDAVENLVAEGYREDQIHLVGNVMIDSLEAHIDRARARPILHELGLTPKSYGLVTLHRPSNVDELGGFRRLLEALSEVAKELPLVYPVHPRARSQLDGSWVDPAIRLIEPVGYLDFLALQDAARVVLTDSGGVQEETTVLGVPCLTIRDSTERPVTVTQGTNRVIGSDPGRIATAVRDVMSGGVSGSRPALWDGHASDRIVDILVGDDRSTKPRPTGSP